MWMTETHRSRHKRTVLMVVIVVASCVRAAEADLPQARWATPLDQGTTAAAVWVADPGDVLPAGANDMILRYVGTAWSPVASGTSPYPCGIQGSGSGDVLTAGGSDTILHYGSSAWLPVSSGATRDGDAVWDSGLGGVLAVGQDGTIPHYVPLASAGATPGAQWSGGWRPGAGSLVLFCGLCWLALAGLKWRRDAVARRNRRSAGRVRRRSRRPDELAWLVEPLKPHEDASSSG